MTLLTDRVLLTAPLLLVKPERKPTDGLNTCKVLKVHKNSRYSVEDVVFIEKTHLVGVTIDGDFCDDYFLIKEEFVKAYVEVL